MDDRDSGRPRPRGAEVAGLSPVRAFLLVAALATIAGAGLFASRDASPSEPPAEPSRSPDHSLTDAEAIAEFERLNAQLMRAYEERNVALAEAVFTSDSPMLPRVRKEIETLIDEGVVSRSRFRVKALEVVRNSTTMIVLERLQVIFPRFETELGEDVTSRSVPEKQRSEWVLNLRNGRWLLHDATITRIVR